MGHTSWIAALVAGVMLPLLGGCADTQKPVARLETASETDTVRTRGAVFVHADGTSIAHWNAARLASVGPDGDLAWDLLPHVGVYRGHMLDSVSGTSHGGATVHAHGVRVPWQSYGIPADAGPPSVLLLAAREGLGTALINSGSITEPGTGVFATHADRRTEHERIAERILASGIDVILGGGERWFLPEGQEGRHGPGRRRDGVDLVARARELGYAVVHDASELAALPEETSRVLGLFAAHHTFHAMSEETLRERGLPLYVEGAPTVAEMLRAALAILDRKGARFLVILEEEGTDNFGNANNASGLVEAVLRADAALARARARIEQRGDLLVLTAADSDAGGLSVLGTPFLEPGDADRTLPVATEVGAPIDGVSGAGSTPFLAAPDARGVRLPFAIAWTTHHDVAGSVVVRAEGPGAEEVSGSVANTRIPAILREALGLGSGH